ncbi:hypothetical protein PE067_14965 [Paracoccus sp. DMF-8]|nr:hypothetical protein [Paracoccus sp. DMF-8]MDF3607319.1 hypothetical protein [Paracoccus sp. DMF-8]
MEQMAAPDMLDALTAFVGAGFLSLYVPFPLIVLGVSPYLLLTSAPF